MSLPLDGGGQVGVMLGESTGEDVMNAFQIGQHVIVPEAEDAIALALDRLGSCNLILRLRVMLPAVDFNNQPRRVAGKIGNVMTDGNLPTEAVALHLIHPEDGL